MARLKLFSDRDLNGPSIAQDRADLRSSEGNGAALVAVKAIGWSYCTGFIERFMLKEIRLSTAPVSWGVDHMGRADLPAWQEVFDEIAKIGFRYTELGPLGFWPEDGKLIKAQLAARRLTCVGAALLASFEEESLSDQALDEARRLARLISDSGGSFLVIVDWSEQRHATAGRSERAYRLQGRVKQEFWARIEKVGEISREFGVQAVAHPHAGSNLEFEDEVEELLAHTDPELIQLAIDTGHCLYGQIDPTALYRRHADRTPYINFKDISAELLDQVRADEIAFLDAVDLGVFQPLGKGDVDFQSFCEALNRNGFGGPAVIEQDRKPGSSEAATAEMVESLRFLSGLGINV
jgi:inosose dehydratase